MEMSVRSNIWKFHLFQVLSNLPFFVPIMVLFWQDNGLSMTEVMLLESFFAIMIVVLEIPSGYAADIFGRKNTLVWAGIIGVFGISAYALGHNFYQFLIAEILLAFSGSFVSGTDAAIVYDSLREIKQEHKFKKMWGSIIFYGIIAMGFANIAGGFIGNFNFRWTFYAMLPFTVICVFVALSLKEPKRHKRIFKRGYTYELFSIIKNDVIKHAKIKWLIIYSGVLYACYSASLWLYQPYFKLSGLDVVYFGLVFASFQLVTAFSSKYGFLLEEKMGVKLSLVFLVVIVGISYFLMSTFIFVFAFVFAYLHQFTRGYLKVVFSDYINRLTTSDIRATVLSARNFMNKLCYALLIPFFGWITDVYSLVHALVGLGITTFCLGGIVLFFLWRSRVI